MLFKSILSAETIQYCQILFTPEWGSQVVTWQDGRVVSSVAEHAGIILEMQ